MLRPTARSTVGEREKRDKNEGKHFVNHSQTEFHNQILLHLSDSCRYYHLQYYIFYNYYLKLKPFYTFLKLKQI